MQDRRRFLTQVATAGAVAAVFPSSSCARKREGKGRKGRAANKARRTAPAEPATEAKPKTLEKSARARVVLVQGPGAVGEGHKVQRKKVRQMLEAGLKSLGRTKDARAAISQWVRPADTVGLKVNCLAGRQMSTHLELVEELVAVLAAAGMPRHNAVVFDRADVDLRRAGYPLREGGRDFRCLGNDRAGYEKELRVMPSGASRFSRVATQQASVLINLPILKDHGLAGISGALKNNFGLVHNPNKFHLNGCDPHVAEVNAQPFLRRKQRLIICDALRAQVEGGPAYHPAGAVTRDAILLATDPVAMDVVLWELLEGLRQQKKLPTLTADKRRPMHIFTAAKQGLGVGKRDRIELIKVKV